MISCLFCITLTFWYLVTKEVNPFPGLTIILLLKSYRVDSIRLLFNIKSTTQMFKENTLLFNLDEITLSVLFIISGSIFMGIKMLPYYLILTLFVYRTIFLSIDKSIRRHLK
jgi:hypothetical protein